MKPLKPWKSLPKLKHVPNFSSFVQGFSCGFPQFSPNALKKTETNRSLTVGFWFCDLDLSTQVQWLATDSVGRLLIPAGVSPIYLNLEPKWSAPVSVFVGSSAGCFGGCPTFINRSLRFQEKNMLHHPLCSEKRTPTNLDMLQLLLGKFLRQEMLCRARLRFFFESQDQRFKGNVSRGISPQVSHEKNPYYFPLYWLFNRNPYIGILESPHNWVV